MKKPIPRFKSEAEEFEFWSSTGLGRNATQYLDWSQAKRAKFPKAEATPRAVSAQPLRKKIP